MGRCYIFQLLVIIKMVPLKYCEPFLNSLIHLVCTRHVEGGANACLCMGVCMHCQMKGDTLTAACCWPTHAFQLTNYKGLNSQV